MCFTTTAIFIAYHHEWIQIMLLRLKTRTNHSLDKQASCTSSKTQTHACTHGHTQTFAAQRSVVGVASWAILTLEGSHRVGAFAFAVAAAVAFQAFVDV